MINTDYYEGAVVRLVTLQVQRNQPANLLFSTITLLAKGRPNPPPMEACDTEKIGKTDQRLYYRRITMSAEDAINWYRSLGNGNDKTPVPTEKSDINKKFDGRDITVTDLFDDPTWPNLGLPINNDTSTHNHPAPFLGSTPARIHRRFGSQQGVDGLLSDENALKFIERRLHINLKLYSEYLGSVALIVSDPILKQIDNFMIPASDNDGERIFYYFIPRPGQDLSALRLTTLDVNNDLITNTSTLGIPENGILDLNKGECSGQYGYIVSHEELGVLAYFPPTGFLRQVTLNMGVQSNRELEITVPLNDSEKSRTMTYKGKQSSSSVTQNIIGSGSSRKSIDARITQAQEHRKKRIKGNQYGQRWFQEGSREQAMRFIQDILRKAEHRVIIADPYLSELQIAQFLYAVDPEIQSLSILTSKKAFGTGSESINKISTLKSQFDKIRPQNSDAEFEIYILNRSNLHDRFLIIDDIVWFLGSSLNNLGETGSLIVKVPNPDEIIYQVCTMLDQSVTIDVHLKVASQNSKTNS